MKILRDLTIKNLKLNKKRTIVTIVGIILSTALMVGIGLLFSSFQDYMISDVINYEGSYHAKYFDIASESLDKIKDEKGLSYFYEKPLGFSMIESKNNYKPYLYISEVSQGYFDELKLLEGRFPENSNELVISNHLASNGGVSYKIGDHIKLDYGYREVSGIEKYSNDSYEEGEKLVITGKTEYEIVGIVSRSVYENYSACGYSVFTLNDNVSGDINLYVSFDKTKKIIKQSSSLSDTLGYNGEISYNSSLLAMYGESKYSNIMSAIAGMMSIMLSLVSIGCIIVIYNSFAISVMERKKEFGLLSSIGSTKRQLSSMVLMEALIVGVIGIILGIISGYIGIGVVICIINNLIGDVLDNNLRLVTVPLFLIIPIIFMVVVVLVSALIPSKRASKVSPIEAIRQNDDIKINKKKIRTSKIISKLFGIEGEIALKNIKRNKKKYRITTLSLFISIVLFISFSAYMNYTINTADEVMRTYDYDISINVYDSTESIDNEVNEILKNDNVLKYVKYNFMNIPIKRNYSFTDEFIKFNRDNFDDEYYEEYLKANYDYISVIILDDDSYEDYKKVLGLTDSKIILFNNYKGVTYRNGNRTNFSTDVIKDKNVTLNICNFNGLDDVPDNIDSYCKKNVNNIFITTKGYDMVSEIPYMSDYKLVVNEKIFKAITDMEINNNYSINIISENYNEIDKLGDKLNKYYNVSYTNIKENTKMSNNLVLAVKILMYGFIALVTLIGVTSVFNTITTSMALRKKEFAVLRSIGLTKKGFNKILFFESLFFGLKSIIYSLPVSFIVILLIHNSLSNMVSSNVICIPWDSIVIAIISVFVIVLFTMLYSTSKIKKHNIIEQIREENI